MKKVIWLMVFVVMVGILAVLAIDVYKYKHDEKPLLLVRENIIEVDSGAIKEYRSLLYAFVYYETEFVQGKEITSNVNGNVINQYAFDSEASKSDSTEAIKYMTTSKRTFYLVGVKDIVLTFSSGLNKSLKEAINERYISFDKYLKKAKSTQNAGVGNIKVYSYPNYIVMTCDSKIDPASNDNVYIGTGVISSNMCYQK